MQDQNELELFRQFAEWSTFLESTEISQRTQRAYVRLTEQFLKDICKKGSAGAYMESPAGCMLIAESYFGELATTDRLPSNSIAAIVSGLRSFHHFTRRPYLKVQTAGRACTSRSSVFGADEIRKLLALSVQDGPLSEVVVGLCLLSGLRLGECQSLEVSDLSADETILVVMNSRDCRIVPVTSRTRRALKSWLQLRANIETRSQSMFITNDGQPMSCRQLDYVIRSIGIRAGCVCSARRLRNTFLSLLINSGADMESVGKVSGIKRSDRLLRFSSPLKRKGNLFKNLQAQCEDFANSLDAR
jgi:site-specific recombinase XerD